MRDYPFNPETLFDFSNSLPYEVLNKEDDELLSALNILKSKYQFPSIREDIGSFISFLINIINPKVVFEMGSGFGFSSFWYYLAKSSSLEKVYLTEIRKDLEVEFNALPWCKEFKQKCDYFQGDAFEQLQNVENIDFLLIDGVKSDYLFFLNSAYEKLSKNAVVLIDNSYWRGSFLDKNWQHKKSAKKIKELHEFVKNTDLYQSVFIPYQDGVTVLRKI